MNFAVENIRQINFWKRNPNSVESIFRLTILPSDTGFKLIMENGEEKRERNLSLNEVSLIIKLLIDDYHLLECEDTYKAYRYEDNKDDFIIKFFLEIDTKDFEYLAIKGIHPFKQPYYKEILSVFNPFFED